MSLLRDASGTPVARLANPPKPKEKTAVALPTDCPYKQILVYCLFMVLKGIGVCLGAAAFLWAADTAGLQTSGSQVYTVRVDPRTGKLVRVPAKRYSRSVASDLTLPSCSVTSWWSLKRWGKVIAFVIRAALKWILRFALPATSTGLIPRR